MEGRRLPVFWSRMGRDSCCFPCMEQTALNRSKRVVTICLVLQHRIKSRANEIPTLLQGQAETIEC